MKTKQAVQAHRTIRSFGTAAMALALASGAAQAKPAIVTLNGGGGIATFNALTQNLADYSKTADRFGYVATGNDAGQAAFLNDDIGYLQPQSAGNPEGYAPGAPTYGKVSGSSVDFAFSNIPFTASQLSNNGSGATGGPLIQFPLIGMPVAIAFHTANLSWAPGSPGLTDAQLCGVLSGEITDWSAIDPGTSSGTPIEVVVPTDGSISTYLLTRHLNAVCTSGNSAFPAYPVPVTRFFYKTASAVNPVFPGKPPANFITAKNDPAIAATMISTNGSFGYLPPEYTSIAPNAKNATQLQVFALVNGQNGTAYLPSTANTDLAFNNPGPGATNVKPPAGMAAAAYQPNWAPSFPQPAAGYPIVGFPMALLVSCLNISSAPHLLGAIRQLISQAAPYGTNDLNEGYVPLQSAGFGGAYTTAINKVFLSNKSGYGLDINDSTTCASYPGR